MPKLIRFGMVGMTGTIINFSVYFTASEVAHLGLNLSAILAFSVAVVNNYILNHRWTFKAVNGNNVINFRHFIYYLIGNIQGLAINLVVLNLVVFFVGIKFHLLGQMLGILFGMLSNFIFAKEFVFTTKRVVLKREKDNAD